MTSNIGVDYESLEKAVRRIDDLLPSFPHSEAYGRDGAISGFIQIRHGLYWLRCFDRWIGGDRSTWKIEPECSS